MARKKSRYQWSVDEDEMTEPAERRDRNEERTQEQALRAMALRLAALPPVKLDRLPLSDLIKEEVGVLAGLGRKSAHRRQLLRVQGLLRQLQPGEREAVFSGAAEEHGRMRMLERQRQELLEGGDDVLSAYLGSHPGVDRQRLRALIRSARREGPAGKDAARRLFQLLKQDES